MQALAQRLEASGIRKLVIGISGGLDSTHALLVAARAMDRIGQPRSHIIGVTMPGYATSTRTLDQALRLMQSIGCTTRQIDIRPSCDRMLSDIGHPAARGEKVHDVTFENVQAGERTSHLFRIANLEGALVAGTGDLSELALGWCTYGVGDHMSHYNVNASVPKTLIRHLVRWVADSGHAGDAGSAVLRDVLDTSSAPSSCRATEADDEPSQSTEDRLGPYALHDFFLFNIVRYGYTPSKVAFLAWNAWREARCGRVARRARTSNATNTRWRTSSGTCGPSSTASSGPASSSEAASPTRPRSAPAARCRRAATGARPATRRRPSGWSIWRESRGESRFRQHIPKTTR